LKLQPARIESASKPEASAAVSSTSEVLGPTLVEPGLESEPASLVPQPPLAVRAQPKGRAVARVGDELIMLPALTDAVKRRLQLLPTDTPPTCKIVVRVARSALESLIEKSLVMQEARRRYPDRTHLETALAEADGHWFTEELPRILRRENAAGEPELRSMLAHRAQSLDDLRETSLLRALTSAMMAGEGGDLEVYLGQLRRRTPITSIMNHAEISASPGELPAKTGTAGGFGG